MKYVDIILRVGTMVACAIMAYYLSQIYGQIASIPRYSNAPQTRADRQNMIESLPMVHVYAGDIEVSSMPTVEIKARETINVSLESSSTVLEVKPDTSPGASPFSVKPDTSPGASPFPVIAPEGLEVTAPDGLDVKPYLDGYSEAFPVRVER